MNYKRIIRPSKIQKEWEQKTRKHSIWTKQYHLPTPIAAIIIIIGLIVFAKPITVNVITFVAKYDILLPSEIIRIMEEIIKNNPDDYNFTIEERLS